MAGDDRTLVMGHLLALSGWSWLTVWPWWVDLPVLVGLLGLSYCIGGPEP